VTAAVQILIWGDQNDPRVFEFFMEKEMLSYFKEVTCQEVGSHVHVQLLQTITLLFDNISNHTSICESPPAISLPLLAHTTPLHTLFIVTPGPQALW